VRAYRWFIVWLVLAYLAWGAIVFAGGWWDDVVAHWRIAVAMVFGSFFAGSTPVGGGAVGYAALVLLMDEPARLGRGFAFAIQSVGMTSAAIYALCARRRIAWGVLRWAMVGSLVATPVGVLVVAPLLADRAVSLVFGAAWALFGVFVLVHIGALSRQAGMLERSAKVERTAGLCVGLLAGGLVAGVTGSGADMLLFVLLVTVYRADLRIAVPSGMMLMAFTSIVGIASMVIGRVELPEGLVVNWLTAAPIVLVGAPIGAMVVKVVPRKWVLVAVAALSLLPLVWAVRG